MPVERNNMDRFTDTEEADRAALMVMGLSCWQVAQGHADLPVDTGNLRRSHTYKVSDDHVDVGVTADYGGYVHNGTSRQKAHPWLKNAAEANEEAIKKAGEAAWRSAMQ